jgi:hypothetical protein
MMGSSEDGDGKGANKYGVTGMTDGPGSVSTLILVVVRSTERGGGKLLLPEEDKLSDLDVDVAKGDDKGVDGDDEGAAEARAAAKRMRTAADHMDMERAHPVAPLWKTGKGMDCNGGNRKEELYGSVTGTLLLPFKLEVRGQTD